MQGVKLSEKNKKILSAAVCYAGTSLFVAVFFFAALFFLNAYPFSETYISAYDLNAQIAPFIEHIFDVFSGKSSLFYSYSLAGGMDMFGSLVYCLISPFTFIYLFFGSGRACYGTSFVLPLKLVCICLSALFYLRKNFKNLPDFVKCALSICYAYCGYLFVANTYINWLDLLIYMPFLVGGFEKLIKNGKKSQFALLLALMLYTSFSITAFSLFIIFPILIAYVFIYYPKKEFPREKRVKITCDICFSLVLAVAVALPIMLPSLIAFSASGRRGGLFENLWGELSVNPLYAKFSYILTDTFAVCLTLFYFAWNGIGDKKSKFLLFAFVLTMIPVLCDECMLLLNFGSYMSYALRFGFLNGFFFFYVAASFLNDVFKKNENRATARVEPSEGCNAVNVVDNEIENAHCLNASLAKNKFSFKNFFCKKITYICTCSVVVLGVSVGWYFLYRGVDSGSYIQYFTGRFAHSLGGLEVVCLLFAGVLCLMALGIPFILKGKLSKKPLVIACAALLIFQVAFYDYALVDGNSSDYSSLAEIGDLTDKIKEECGGYERIKLAGDYVSADAPLTLHTNSFSVFSSMVDERNFAPINFFKYGGNGKNVMRSYNGTMLGDCLLGYEYLITETSSGVPCYSQNPAYKSINGTYKAYKNEWVFPHAFTVKSANTGRLEKGDAEDYKKLLSFLGAQTSVFEYELSPSNISFAEYETSTFARLKFTCDVKGNLFIKCEVPEDVELEYCTDTKWEKDKIKSFSYGQIIKAGRYSYSLYVRLKNGGELTKEQLSGWFSSFIVADTSVKEAYKAATDGAAEIKLVPNSITATVTAEEGEYLLLNYIALNGHTAYVNGKKTELTENGLNFMLIKLDGGYNEVKIVYRSPYITYALIGVVVGLVFVFAVLVLYKLKGKFKNLFFGAVYYAAIGLSTAVLAFFFVFPIALTGYKGIKQGVVFVIKLFS